MLEDLLPYLGNAPFAWLTICEPAPDDAAEELEDLQDQSMVLQDRQNLSARDAVAAERVRQRYQDLARGSGGVWRARVLAAGADEQGATTAAALLCSTGDLHTVPYVLRPGKATGFTTAITAEPAITTGDLIVAIARPPAREIPGTRLVEPAQFDLTPERHGEIHVGDILDNSDQLTNPFTVHTTTLNRHTLVAGATGAGKSQTVRHLLEQLHHATIPWLVIEPAKAEYARMAGRIGGDHVTIIRPGDPDQVPVGLNPLEPEPGFPLQTHLDLIRALFLAAFDADEPFPQVLSHALTRCYTNLGWDLALNEPRWNGITPRYPSLSDLQHTALDVVAGIGYGKEITDNVRGFIDVRLSSLRLGTAGRFFEGGHPLNLADLLQRNVVLEIEDVGNDQDKAFFIGAVLIRLYEHLRTHRSYSSTEANLRHITVIEEAHRLLKNVEPGSPAAHAVEIFTSLLAEVRAYGDGIIVAEQIPTKIASDVIKNTALKIIHRLPAADDRDTVGATMNLDDTQSRHIVSLPPGRAVVFTDGMDRPIRITIPLGEHREQDLATPIHTVPFTAARLAACDPRCLAGQRCTLRRTAQATRLTQENPELVLWIELITLAYITGEPIPTPRPDWRDQQRQQHELRILSCAIAQLAHQATDTRYTHLVRYYTPEHLATHVANVARAHLTNTPPPDDQRRHQWQAGPYRWTDIHTSLLNHDPSTGPHPDIDKWRARGLHLAGRTTAEQIAELAKHGNKPAPPTLLLGTRHPAALITAASEPGHYPDAITPLIRATDFLDNTDPCWLAHLLLPSLGETT